MPRPQLDKETTDRITEAVDARTKVPARHLTTDEQIGFVLDALDETETRASRLQSKVKELEAELERARSAASDDTDDPPGIDEIASGSATNLPNGLGPNRR
jgi:hypothetical protein